MGRVKLKIKRLESSTNRLTTYSKRKNGLIKKTKELSVLCDIDVALLMFSPSGRPVMWKGRNSSIEGLIERFAELTPQERVKRKLESFDALKRSYRKSDHNVNVQDFFGSSYQTTEDLTITANLLRTQLSEIQKRLSDWNNLDKIDNFELLVQMEDYIRRLFNQIHIQKENIGKQQFLAPNQFQNGMHLPFEQQVRHLSWIQNDDNQHMVSPKDPNLHPKRCLFSRETELSAGNSFGNFGTVDKAEIARTGQETGVLSELLRTESLRNGLIGLKTETLRNELTKTESLKNELMQTESLKNESSNRSDNFHSLQLQNEMFLPFSLGAEQQVQQFSWIQNDDSQHMASTKEPNLFPRRETELFAGNSFGNCSGYFGTVENTQIASVGQASCVLTELLRTESLMNELIGLKTGTLSNNLTNTESLKNDLMKTESLSNKQIKSELLTNELIKTEHLMNDLIKTESLRNELIKAEPFRNELMITESLRNELINTKSLRLQLYEQYPYPQYNFSILPDKKFQPAQQMDLQLSIDDYCAERNFEHLHSGSDSTHCNWASTSGPSIIATFDEYLYPQQHYSPDRHVAEEFSPLHLQATHHPSNITN